MWRRQLTDDPLRFRRYGRRGGRLQRALDGSERVTVYGDYDCDGVTSTVLLYSYLKKNGADVRYIPEREARSYRLHRSSVEALARGRGTPHRHSGQRRGRGGGGRLRRRTGCGRGGHGSSYAAGPYAPGRWRWWIPTGRTAAASTRTTPGWGVAFKLVCALDGDADAVAAEYGDLVALGTLADVMPLTGENRKLVRMGLRRITEGARPGLKCLAQVVGVWGKEASATSVAFSWPRINAAGRMGSPDAAARLLLQPKRRKKRSRWPRRSIRPTLTEKRGGRHSRRGVGALSRLPGAAQRPGAGSGREGWHPGVIGIIAARVVEQTGKPCLILSVSDGRRPDRQRLRPQPQGLFPL